MENHGLFQAICRVNRLDSDDKEYGYIVDYKDLFDSVERSMFDYTTGALDDYDQEDVKGLLGDRVGKGRQHLDETLEMVRALCEPVEEPRQSEDYSRYFIGTDLQSVEHARRRSVLYKTVTMLLRAYADIATDLEAAGYTPAQLTQLQKEVKHYEALRGEIKLRSGDAPDLKQYEPAMRYLIDTYIRAEDSRVLTQFDDMSLVELLVKRGKEALDALPTTIKKDQSAVAETIENNVRRLIISEGETNPLFFGKMSALLEELVKRRKEAAINYQTYLEEVIALARQVTNPSAGAYPATVKTRGQRAIFDNYGNDEELTITLDTVIHQVARNGWLGNTMKEKEIRNAIRNVLRQRGIDDAQADALLELVKKQGDYLK